MADEFLVVWLDDGNSVVTHHRTLAEAFKRASDFGYIQLYRQGEQSRMSSLKCGI